MHPGVSLPHATESLSAWGEDAPSMLACWPSHQHAQQSCSLNKTAGSSLQLGLFSKAMVLRLGCLSVLYQTESFRQMKDAFSHLVCCKLCRISCVQVSYSVVQAEGEMMVLVHAAERSPASLSSAVLSAVLLYRTKADS